MISFLELCYEGCVCELPHHPMLGCQKGQREQALDICKPYCQFQDKLMPPLFGEEAGIKTPP